MKKINVSALSRKEVREAHNETAVLAALDHPNVVRHRESFVHRGFLCIVMDYADGGEARLARDSQSSPATAVHCCRLWRLTTCAHAFRLQVT